MLGVRGRADVPKDKVLPGVGTIASRPNHDERGQDSVTSQVDDHPRHYSSCGCTEAQIGKLHTRIEHLMAALTTAPCRRCRKPVGPPIQLSDGRVIAAAFCPKCTARRVAAAVVKGKGS